MSKYVSCPRGCGNQMAAVSKTCKACNTADRRAVAQTPEQRYQKYKKAHPTYNQDYYQANKEKVLKREADKREVRKRDRQIYLRHSFRHSALILKIDPDLVLAKFDEIGNTCEACGRTPGETERRVAIDHDHLTGEFRGFLCGLCNVLLGQLEKLGIETLHQLVEYLNRHTNK